MLDIRCERCIHYSGSGDVVGLCVAGDMPVSAYGIYDCYEEVEEDDE